MNFTSFLFGLIVISIFAASFSIFLTDVSNTYNVTTNTSFVNSFDRMNDIARTAQQINEENQGQSVNEGDVTESLSKQAFRVVDILYKGIGFFISMANDLGEQLQLPAFVIQGVIAMVMIGLGLVALRVLLKAFGVL